MPAAHEDETAKEISLSKGLSVPAIATTRTSISAEPMGDSSAHDLVSFKHCAGVYRREGGREGFVQLVKFRESKEDQVWSYCHLSTSETSLVTPDSLAKRRVIKVGMGAHDEDVKFLN